MKFFVDDGNVGAAGGVEPLPLVLEGAREADQGHECANGHADSDQRQQGPEASAPEILPGESGERQLGAHDTGMIPQGWALDQWPVYRAGGAMSMGTGKGPKIQPGEVRSLDRKKGSR